MSNILETCWHGQSSKEEAENRLSGAGKTNAYLFRESDIKGRRFLLSYISDKDCGLFKHVFVPNPSARKSYSSVSEASGVMERMVLITVAILSAQSLLTLMRMVTLVTEVLMIFLQVI